MELRVCCGCKEALEAPRWPLLFCFAFLNCIIQVTSLFFEGSDLPLLSAFVPASHAVGWSLEGT